ncbi:PKD domain-containing protein [Chitinophaga sp. sic0106]|uniref:PKD domain-containing protein n=1 Tax=Chitinophaga sp. sic0106 TaxID=2854785 RepID=UPI001C47C162|nr:PKD domain-containing protein [Chitinophaga sp. sic0106]MBV7531470.1 PKD domain-containing protein [Chitinophaga sp. sic0106]
MKYLLPIIVLLLLKPDFMWAQSQPLPQLPAFPQDTVPAEIVVTGGDDSIQVSAKLRPLRQIAGAPAAFYTYFWELGDGTFSFSKIPELHYKDTGTYQLRLYATNNYDDGKAPPTKPRAIKVKKPVKAGIWASNFFRSNGNIEMKINRNPKPGEDFVALIGYRNITGDVGPGSLVLFYNERQFDRACFGITEKRNYAGMDSSSMDVLLAQLEGDNNEMLFARGPAAGTGNTPNSAAKALLQNMQQVYNGHTVMKFNTVQQAQEQFLFVTMHTLPEMIADTNAVVSMTAILVPDNPSLQPEAYTLEMPVVASHDPNRMQLKKRRINYRLMGKKKELTYKVQFQNTGKGPAKKVAIGIAVPRQLNTETVAINDMSPVCIACDSAYNTQSCIDTVRTKDSLYFVFRNIYLPGMQQDGVSDPDSTKGFISYTIRFKKKPKKIPFSSSAAIIFDKNEPIYTNRATAKFIKGISPAIVAGYTFSPDKGDYTLKGPLQLGAVLAPFAPSRPYFQVEAYAGLLEEEAQAGGFTRDKRDTTVDGQAYMISGRSNVTTVTKSSFQMVPLHFRYNITRWLGVGAGALAQVNISTKTTTEEKAYLSDFQQPAVILKTVTSTVAENTAWFASLNAAAFADIQAGSVKAGPALGLRYIRQVTGNTPNRFFVYAIYRL